MLSSLQKLHVPEYILGIYTFLYGHGSKSRTSEHPNPHENRINVWCTYPNLVPLVLTHSHICMYVYIYIYICVYMYIHVCKHIYIYIHIHVHETHIELLRTLQNPHVPQHILGVWNMQVVLDVRSCLGGATVYIYIRMVTPSIYLLFTLNNAKQPCVFWM